MKGAISLLTSIVILAASTAFGQGFYDDEVRMEVSFVSGVAVGQFQDHLDGAAIGGTFLIGGRVPGLPIVLGTEVGLLNYRNHDQLFLTGVAGIPVSTAALSSTGNIALGHLVARIQPPSGVFVPYIEGVVGLKYFFSRSRVSTDLPLPRMSRASSSTSFDDLSLSAGGGGGLLLTVYRGAMGWDHRIGAVSLDLGLRYMVGEKASVLAADAVNVEGGQITFNTVRTRTDMLMPRLGVRVSI